MWDGAEVKQHAWLRFSELSLAIHWLEVLFSDHIRGYPKPWIWKGIGMYKNSGFFLKTALKVRIHHTWSSIILLSYWSRYLHNASPKTVKLLLFFQKYLCHVSVTYVTYLGIGLTCAAHELWNLYIKMKRHFEILLKYYTGFPFRIHRKTQF